MKPVFEALNNKVCSFCGHKKLWVIVCQLKGNIMDYFYYGKLNLKQLVICHECINDMGFELAKAMKPENFKE